MTKRYCVIMRDRWYACRSRSASCPSMCSNLGWILSQVSLVHGDCIQCIGVLNTNVETFKPLTNWWGDLSFPPFHSGPDPSLLTKTVSGPPVLVHW